MGALTPGPLSSPVVALQALPPNETTGVALAIAAVVLLGVGYAWHRYRNRSQGALLRRRLGAVQEVSVLMHANPDPDAMASAVAVKHIAESAGTRATVQYPGEIRHPENRAFRTVLDLDLEQIGHVQDLAGGAVVLVDHNRSRGFDGAGTVAPYAVIDHHPGDGTGEAFTDVRTDYGACASILAEYFESLNADHATEADGRSNGVTLPTDVATGLAYGILTDTKNLTRGCTSADFAALEYLYEGADPDLLDRMANPQVDAEMIDVLSDAIANREERPPYAVSDVGTVDNLDAIPAAADTLLDLEGLTVVVVIGENDGKLHFSGRSRDDRVHVGRALEAAVEDIPMAGAGGHARMGGGQVSLTHMEGLRPGSGLSREEFHEKLFDTLAGED